MSIRLPVKVPKAKITKDQTPGRSKILEHLKFCKILNISRVKILKNPISRNILYSENGKIPENPKIGKPEYPPKSQKNFPEGTKSRKSQILKRPISWKD